MRALLCLLVALSGMTSSLDAQQIRGAVLLQGTEAPVRAADVTLLDEELRTVARARTDGDGRFEFRGLAPGSYSVQGARGGVQTALASVQLDDTPVDVVLELPSPIVVLALTCPAAGDGTTTLVGSVHDGETAVALPGARLVLSWENGHAEAMADDAGLYRFCAVPAGRPLSMTARALGRSATASITLTPAPINRFDLPLGVGDPALDILVRGRLPLADSATARVRITLHDAATHAPLEGAAVWLGAGRDAVITAGTGSARFERVRPGPAELRIEMLGYGARSAALDIPAGEDLDILVRVPPRPVELDPIAVRSAMRSETRAPRESTTRVDIVAGSELARAEARAASVSDVLRGRFPGLLVTDGAYSTIDNPELERMVCIESTRRLDRLRLPPGVSEPFCEMVVVVYDGVPITSAGTLIRNLSVRDLESIEYLGPIEAGLRYGARASQNGALVLWTRGTGPYRSSGRNGG